MQYASSNAREGDADAVGADGREAAWAAVAPARGAFAACSLAVRSVPDTAASTATSPIATERQTVPAIAVIWFFEASAGFFKAPLALAKRDTPRGGSKIPWPKSERKATPASFALVELRSNGYDQ
jgi:hypothetical protein